jgi:radical SAM protein with 4Fe4S-binding SPASM domain
LGKIHYTEELSRHGDIEKYLGNIIGKKFTDYRKKWNEIGQYKLVNKFPIQINLETLNNCNYRCVFCRWGTDEIKSYKYKEKMSEHLFKKILNEINSNYCACVDLVGLNEPLLDKDLVNKIKLIKNTTNVVDIRFNTNGSLLNEKKSLELIDSGLTRIMISLDAVKKETYEKVRIRGDFNKVVNNVFRFIKLRDAKKKKLPVVRVTFVKTNSNSNEIQEFIKFWYNKADVVAVQNFRVPSYKSKDYEFLKIKSKKSKDDKGDITCSQPNERVFITAKGDVRPCASQYNDNLTFGNVYKESIKDIFNNKNFKKLRENFISKNWSKNPICKKCLTDTFSLD